MIFGCPFASDAGTGMRVVLLPDAEPEPREGVGAIATNAAPPDESQIPVMPEWVARAYLQPDANALAEAELIRSFFEGVPFAVGEQRRLAYEQRKRERRIERM